MWLCDFTIKKWNRKIAWMYYSNEEITSESCVDLLGKCPGILTTRPHAVWLDFNVGVQRWHNIVPMLLLNFSLVRSQHWMPLVRCCGNFEAIFSWHYRMVRLQYRDQYCMVQCCGNVTTTTRLKCGQIPTLTNKIRWHAGLRLKTFKRCCQSTSDV